MVDFDFRGSLLHHTWCSLLKAASAFSFLNLMAILGGVVQLICDPRYFAVLVVDTGSPLANVIVLLLSGWRSSSVFSVFSSNPYNVASTWTAWRKGSNCSRERAIRAVSSAYSKS